MGFTNFPKGITSMGVPVVGGGTLPLTSGTYWFVSSVTGSNSNSGKQVNKPLATLDYAIGKCTAGKSDVIVLLPGHTESLSAANAIDFDVDDITVVGIGSGDIRPKLSWTAAAATMVIDANNTAFYNVEFEAKYADVAVGIDVGAVDGLIFDKCWFTENAANLNWVIIIDLATGAKDITINQCKVYCGDAANDSFINGVACNGLTVLDSQIYFTVAQTVACGQIATSGNATNTTIKNCDFVSLVDGALHIDLNGAANTGIIAECYFSSADGAGAVTTGIDATGCHVFECYFAGEADSFGLVGGGTVYNNS